MGETLAGDTLGGLLAEARHRLEEAGIAEPRADARLLVGHLTGTTLTDALTAPDRVVGAGQAAAVRAAIERRLGGEPAHRILGRREFRGLALALSPDTLEPRSDTEALVDLVLPFARRIVERQGRCRVLDLGTGTGAIALALLGELPAAEALGVDILPGAVEIANANADLNGYGARFKARLSDWFSAVEGRFHIIVSNPPYIAAGEWQALTREVRDFDPEVALDGGVDGLEAYRRIGAGAAAHLAPDGVVAVETGYAQGDAVTGIFKALGYGLEASGRDLGGHDRALVFAPDA